MLNLCLNQWLHCIHVSLEWRSKMLYELNMYDVMGVVNLKLEYLNLTSAGHCNTCMRPLFCCSDWMHNGREKLIAQITHAIKLLTTIGIWNSQMGLNQHQWHILDYRDFVFRCSLLTYFASERPLHLVKLLWEYKMSCFELQLFFLEEEMAPLWMEYFNCFSAIKSH